MPIYEYECKKCGVVDVLQKISEGTKRKCPECGTLGLKKLVSAPSFQLKGSGWYATDFKDGGKAKKEDKKEGDEKSKEASKSETTETKSETPKKDTETKSETKKGGKTKAA